MHINYLPRIFFIALLGITFFSPSFAQTKPTVDSVSKVRAETAFFELFGPGITFSANYDTRFSNRRDGAGIRVGLGYFADESFSFFTLPVQLNYLLGKKNKFFEIGAGATYANLHDKYKSNSDFLSFDNDDTVIGTLTFGYRYQPEDSGFNFRVAFNPLFNSNSFVPFIGISFGYTIK